VLVDGTNPLRSDAAGPVWDPPAEGSSAQALAAALVAGDDDTARVTVVVLALATRFGFRGVDAGPLRNAGLLENLAILRIHLAVKGGFWRHFAFRVDART